MNEWTETKSDCIYCGNFLKFRYRDGVLQFKFEHLGSLASAWLTLRRSAPDVVCNRCGHANKMPERVLLFAYGTTEIPK